MHIIPAHSIVVAQNRQRREFNPDKLRQLSESIQRNGLLHPIVIESLTDRRLLVGERRLRVVSAFGAPFRCDNQTIMPGHIPVLIFGELTELQRQEVEYEENAIREDLSWQEKNQAIARLHALRTAQAADRGERQTYTATATEIKGDNVKAPDVMAVRHATILEPFLSDPEVAKAKTEKEALSIARKKLTAEFATRLAQNFDQSKSKSPHAIIHGDLREVLPGLAESSFDCIIVDPPYGIDAHKMSTLSGSESGIRHEYEDTFEYAFSVWEAIFSASTRLCKASAHLYMFCDFRHWTTLSEMAESYGWAVWATPIIWHKPSGGMLGDTARGPRKSYELILYASRGDRKVTGVYLDVIVANAADTEHHAAAKPVEVYTNLLRRSCHPGDRVIDMCCGGGTIFPAANRLRLIATGIEGVERHYANAMRRLEEV